MLAASVSPVALKVIMTIIWAVCLVLNILIAQKRNKKLALWIVLSIFFSWIALIINALTGRKKD